MAIPLLANIVASSNRVPFGSVSFLQGRIAVGSDGDVVVWDPNATRTISAKTHHHACDFNIFEGMVCHGVPLYVLSRGRIVRDPDGVHAVAGSGEFVPNPPYSEIVYGRIRQRDKINKPCLVDRQPYDGPVIRLGSS